MTEYKGKTRFGKLLAAYRAAKKQTTGEMAKKLKITTMRLWVIENQAWNVRTANNLKDKILELEDIDDELKKEAENLIEFISTVSHQASLLIHRAFYTNIEKRKKFIKNLNKISEEL